MADFDQLDEQGQLDLIISLQGEGGYTAEDDSARVAELSGVARIAYLASQTLLSAARNMLPSKAVELLDQHEILMDAPSNERLTDAQRQARLKAFMRALPKLLAHRIDNAAAGLTGASTGSSVSYGAATQALGNAPAQGAFYLARQEPAADDQELVALDTIMRNGAPARSIVGATATSAAAYGSGSCDRITLEPYTVANADLITKARIAPMPYYVGSTLLARDWREIQAMLLWKSVGFSLNQDNQGNFVIVSGTIASGATSVIASGDWSVRVIQAWGVLSGTDIRSSDFSALTLGGHVWCAPSKTGTSGSPFVQELEALDGAATSCYLFDDGAGLKLTNSSGATRYFVLMIRSSPKYTAGSSTDSEPWIDPEDTVYADMGYLWQAAGLYDGTLTNCQRAGMRRIFSTGALSAVAADETQHVVLDSSEDWRERTLLILPLTESHATQNVAPNTTGVEPRSGLTAVPRLFRTDAGNAIGLSAAQPYQHADLISAPDIWIFADEDTGNLIAEMKAGDSTHARACGMFLVIASERTDDDGYLVGVPVTGTAVTAHDLNTLQDIGCYAQGHQGGVPRQSADDVPGTAVTAQALGEISESTGLPRTPAVWQVRERVGRADDSTFEARQPILGQRKRLLSVSVGAGATVDVDTFDSAPSDSVDQADYRDRLIWIEGRYSSLDITISGSNVSDVLATPFCWCFYSGPYDTAAHVFSAGSLDFEFFWSRQPGGYSSKLTVTNSSGAAIRLTLATEMTGHLGLSDRRLYGANP